VLSSEFLIIGKVWFDVLRALVQLLGPSKGRFTEALHDFPVNTVSLHQANRLDGEPYFSSLPFWVFM
jgi:hypothetical protein